MCHNDADWVRLLSTVLLGLRTHVRPDTGASPAEYVYGTTLRIPGEFCLPDDFRANPQIFVEEFRQHMVKIKPVPVAHRYKKRAFSFKELHTCTHVFLRVAAVKRPLERPYTGPHKVLERVSDHVYKIDVNGTAKTVSTEHLKPAHFIPDDLPNALTNSDPLVPPGKDATESVNMSVRPPLKTYKRKSVKIDLRAELVNN